MSDREKISTRSLLGSLALIGVVVTGSAGAFAYTAGWFSPDRLTPTKLVGSLAPPGGAVLGYRRNHAKGICFTGIFEANGNGTELSQAQVFASGRYPVIGRFNLATPNPFATDDTVRVRGLGLQISTPDRGVWRSAMIDAPVFAVSSPEDFYALQRAGSSKDPDAMKSFAAAHPEFAGFAHWAGTAPWTGSYAEEPYNGLNAFLFTNADGTQHAVRWLLQPQAQVMPISKAEFAKLGGPNYLDQEIIDRVSRGPQRWTMVVTVANPGDPTSDPTKPWPADRRSVEVGTLVVQKIEAEADGPCRDITFDPTILPKGISVSDDQFPAARSAAYAKSYDARIAEAKSYPHTLAAGDNQ